MKNSIKNLSPFSISNSKNLKTNLSKIPPILFKTISKIPPNFYSNSQKKFFRKSRKNIPQTSADTGKKFGSFLQ